MSVSIGSVGVLALAQRWPSIRAISFRKPGVLDLNASPCSDATDTTVIEIKH